MEMLSPYLRLLGRIILSILFIRAGLHKFMFYGDTQAYMAAHHVSGTLLPLVILTELGCGLAILLGIFTQWAALLLAGFCLLAAYLFHYHPGDAPQMMQFVKDVTIAGGFLVLAGAGPGTLSLESLRRGRNEPGQ